MQLTAEREKLLAPLQAVISSAGLGEAPETAGKAALDGGKRATMLRRASGTMN